MVKIIQLNPNLKYFNLTIFNDELTILSMCFNSKDI